MDSVALLRIPELTLSHVIGPEVTPNVDDNHRELQTLRLVHRHDREKAARDIWHYLLIDVNIAACNVFEDLANSLND